MRCPYCQSEDTQVKDSRPAEDGGAIRRRRVCTVCGGRFTTFEDVAYVRFASVYRNFREAKDFHEVLGELKGDEDAA
jgi:transcriptional regulator NrdR family protein